MIQKIIKKTMGKNNLPIHKAVILAGGKGIRLYPITQQIPKPLLSVNRKPIINCLVDLFQQYGVEEISVLINKDFQEDFKWWKARYYARSKIKIFGEEKPLGTFGGLSLLKNWTSDRPFFFANGDILIKKINLTEMNNFHQKMKTQTTIALVKVPNPKDYGTVLFTKGLIEKFLEKPKNPPTKYVSSGLYLLSPEIFKYHPGPKFSMIETYLFPKLAQEKKLAGFKFNGNWMDCGTWERYSKALKKWK